MISSNGDDGPAGDEGCLLRSAKRRELILDFIQTYGRPISLSELEAALVDGSALANALDAAGDLDGDELGVRLHHVHLPKLDRSGAIEYDASRRIVRPRFG